MRKNTFIAGLALGIVSVCAVGAMAAAPSDKDLVLRYTFDDFAGNKVVDATDNKLNGNVEGPIAQADGKSGKALVMDGNDTFVLLPEKSLDKLSEFTIAVWTRMDEKRPWSRLFDLGANTKSYIFVAPVSGHQSAMAEAMNDGTNTIAHHSPQFGTGEWHHVAVSLKGKTLRFFLDGSLAAWNSYADDYTPDFANWAIMEQNYIGKSQYADPLYKGLVDEFRIYRKALSDDEVASLAGR